MPILISLTGQFISPQMPGVSRSANVNTDLNNFAPRFGFAWTPWDSRTVIRGGFGIFYDVQADQNDAELAYNPTGLFFSQTINNPPTTPSIRLSTGLPAPSYPDLTNPSGKASAEPFNNRTTYIEEWNFNIERALAKDMVLQVAYVGTHGVKLASLSNLNQPFAPLDSNFGLAPNFGRPYFSTVPNIGPIRTTSNQFDSISHGLQVRFEKRFSSNWSMLDSYTWQHTIGQSEEDEYLEPQNTHNLAAERGNNGPDYRHQFTSAWSYDLPIGPGQRFWTSTGPIHWVTGGWQLNGIIALYSGQAFTPLLSFDPTNTGSGSPRPDLIGNPYDFSNAMSAGCPSNQQTIQCWYNPAAFAVPPLRQVKRSHTSLAMRVADHCAVPRSTMSTYLPSRTSNSVKTGTCSLERKHSTCSILPNLGFQRRPLMLPASRGRSPAPFIAPGNFN